MTDWPMAAAGAAAVLFALLMLTRRSLYSAALCLLAAAFQLAAMFFLSGAPLLGFLQIVIYAGAVMVLVVVTIMAAPRPHAERFERLSLPRPLAWAAVLALAAEVAVVVSRAAAGGPAVAGALAAQERVGPFLFGPYALATEAVTLLMLVAGLALIEEPAA